MPRRAHRFIFAIFAVFAVPALSSGQWLKYPTEGVPKNSDGTPNREAPTPRQPDGKPDFSGL